MFLLSATARRLAGPLAHRPRDYLQSRWGYSRRGAALAHLLALLAVTAVLLVVLPATAFYLLEATWSYLDAVYFCAISLCTVGFGDLVPARQARQPLRQLYQVAVAGESGGLVWVGFCCTGLVLLGWVLGEFDFCWVGFCWVWVRWVLLCWVFGILVECGLGWILDGLSWVWMGWLGWVLGGLGWVLLSWVLLGWVLLGWVGFC
uniref:Potassium channel domain-containing protein n=1 Tax=Catharus ustulatus TaxID=91951 RepID=A0A8C3UYB6_CATUS